MIRVAEIVGTPQDVAGLPARRHAATSSSSSCWCGRGSPRQGALAALLAPVLRSPCHGVREARPSELQLREVPLEGSPRRNVSRFLLIQQT